MTSKETEKKFGEKTANFATHTLKILLDTPTTEEEFSQMIQIVLESETEDEVLRKMAILGHNGGQSKELNKGLAGLE